MFVPTAFEYNNETFEGNVFISNREIIYNNKKNITIRNLNETLFDLLKLNVYSDDDILLFIQNHGFLYREDNINKINIDDYILEILTIRSIINLRYNCIQRDYEKIINNFCIIVACDKSSVYSFFNKYCDNPIIQLLSTMPKKYLSLYKCYNCDQLHPRAIVNLLPFSIDVKTGFIQYKFSYVRYYNLLTNAQKDIIRDVALRYCVDIINKRLSNIILKIGYNYQGDWVSESLITSIYYILFIKFTNNIPLKKCECTTCLQYFEVIGNYPNKKYCSAECALLEAKRKERSRKKALRLK